MASEIITLIVEAFKIDSALEDDTPLISSGIIDSFRVAALVAALESRYAIRIDLRRIGVDNFDTARQMHRFIHEEKKHHGSRAAGPSRG
jgi:acyl carrier protein